jgi:hypothetical protein
MPAGPAASAKSETTVDFRRPIRSGIRGRLHGAKRPISAAYEQLMFMLLLKGFALLAPPATANSSPPCIALRRTIRPTLRIAVRIAAERVRSGGCPSGSDPLWREVAGSVYR